MKILVRLKETVVKKSKVYYFYAGLLSAVGLLFIATNLYFTNNIIAGNPNEIFPQGL